MSKAVSTQACPDFYTVGGTLEATAQCYISRVADQDLKFATRQSQFCYVLTPRQMGKSSLMVQTAQFLNTVGVRTVIIDLTSIGTAEISPEAWYLGQVQEITEQLGLKDNFISWWEQRSYLSVVQRFSSFLSNFVLDRISDDIVIFVDEIDSTLSLPFQYDDYFAAIRALYNKRRIYPKLKRISFVLLGVVSPSDLISDPNKTPFNIGRRIHLTDFGIEEAQPLIQGLAPDPTIAAQLLEHTLVLTGGHPYLTQRTCEQIARWAQSGWDPSAAPTIVEEIVKETFLSEIGKNTDDNLRFVKDRIVKSDDAVKLLECYRKIREGKVVQDDELDPVIAKLKLSGLLRVTDAGQLRVSNPIYERVFDEYWIRSALSEYGAEENHVNGELYDVLIDYSNRDRELVKSYLIPRLSMAGLRVWTEEHILAGENFALAMERAFAQSRSIIIVLSPDWMANQWQSFERRQFLYSPRESSRIIPILVRPIDIPTLFKELSILDFTKEERWEGALEQLLLSLGVPAQRRWRRTQIPPIVSSLNRYHTSAIRRMLNEAFEDDELAVFTYDYFRSLYTELFSSALKHEKIQSLIVYSEQRGMLDELLDAVARERPKQYRKFANQLQISQGLEQIFQWSQWIPLEGCWKGDLIPNRPGLYQIKRADSNEIDYIGQTGDGGMTLKLRLGMLRGVYENIMPKRSPHTAAPALWALRESTNCSFEVAVLPIETSAAWRKGLKCLAISLYRQKYGQSPTVNFGRILSGYHMPSTRENNLSDDEMADDSLGFSPSIPPVSSLNGNPQALDWCGLQWSNWVPLTKRSADLARGASGLYRIRSAGRSELLFIGQGKIRERLIAHLKKINTKTDVQGRIFQDFGPVECSWIHDALWDKRQRQELLNDLIAAYIFSARDIPPAQFIGP